MTLGSGHTPVGASGLGVDRHKGLPSLTKWFLPNVAMWISFAALVYGLYLGDGPGKLFRDSDTGWHIRNGESILAGNPLHHSDPYSFSKANQEWFAWEWAADVAMGAAHKWDGLAGVATLFALCGAVCTWIWLQLHWASGGNFFVACAMASPLFTTISLHWLARPHVFGWLFCLLTLLAMEHAPVRFRWWYALCFFAAGSLWANTHASFLFLPGLAIIYLLGSFCKAIIWGDLPRYQAFLWAAVCGFAGTFVNPYGWHLHQHVLTYLANRELLSRIGEFQSFNFQAEGALPVLIMVMIVAIGIPLSLYRRKPEHFLLTLLLLAMALRSARALPLVALLALPIANGAISAALREAQVSERLRRMLDHFFAYSTRIRVLDRRCAGYAWIPVFVFLAIVPLHSRALAGQVNFPAKEFPVIAANEVAKLPVDARILAPDKFGGYLIYRFQGSRKVYFDGRSDFYGVDFMKDYIRLMEARPGWREQVERWNFDYALLPNNYSLVAGLEQWGWHVIYRDETATLLRK